MTCDVCGAPTRYVERVRTGDKIIEIHLCERCRSSALKNGLTPLDLLVTLKESQGRYCPTCGTTEKDFEATFKFGCADCYKYMSGIALMAAERVQDGLTHVGKRL
jgi:protein-arginine kinase activator protein McsA